jgi:hemoglobin
MTEAPDHDLTEDAIRTLVDQFYAKVRQGAELSPVFARAIPDDAWPNHLAVITDFWSSVMLRTGRYRGNPLAAHQRVAGINAELFDRWLALWRETAHELFQREAAEALSAKAILIADSLKAGLFFTPGGRAPTR